jgi:hypothetical protein
MKRDLALADEYRDKAQQLRIMAMMTSEPSAREALVFAADGYDQLATLKEQLAGAWEPLHLKP